MVNEKELIEKLKKVAEALRKTTDPAARKRTQQMLKASFLSIRNQLSPRTCGIMDKVVEKLIEESLEPTPVPPAEELPWDKVKEFLFEPGANAEDVKKAILQCVEQFSKDSKQTYKTLLTWMFYEGMIENSQTAIDNILAIYEEVLKRGRSGDHRYNILEVVPPLNYMFYKFFALNDRTTLQQIYIFYVGNSPISMIWGDDSMATVVEKIMWDFHPEPLDQKEIEKIKTDFEEAKKQARRYFDGNFNEFIAGDPSIIDALYYRMQLLFKVELQKRIKELAKTI